MDLFNALLWIFATFLALWITYRYLTAKENPWKQEGIQIAPTWKLFAGIIELLFYPLHDIIMEDYRRYGKLSARYLFGSLSLFVAYPDMIREILVKNFQNFVNRLEVESGDPLFDNMLSIQKGEKWKKTRAVMSPTFSTGKIKKMTKTIVECADTLRKNLEKSAESNKPADIKKLIGAFTMDTIASTAFSTKVDSHNDPNNPFVIAASQFFTRRTQWRSMIIFTFSKLARLLRIRMNTSSMRFFTDIAVQMIEERRKSKQARIDFLQLMLNASEESKQAAALNNSDDDEVDDDNNKLNGKTPDIKSEDNRNVEVKNYEGLSDTEIVAQCVIFFVAGFEPVASTISFTLYELALNEEYQEKLIAEIDEVLQNKDELRYEDVQEMKYLDCVVSETLRKYPLGAFLQRIATNDCTIGDKNIKIPKGSSVTVPVYALHYDPEYYPDPEEFIPERFSPEEKASRDPYVYLPFGAGPRNCIAMRFALMEVKLCVAHLLRHLRFRKCSATQVPLKFESGQPQLMAKNILLSVEKRKDVSA